MQHDVPAPRANGHADADLARALRDRNQHDIHDPDATYQKRNGSDTTKENRHDPRAGGSRFSDVREIANHEIVLAVGTDAVPLAKQSRNLLLGFLHAFRADRRNHDALHVSDPHEPFLHGGVGH